MAKSFAAGACVRIPDGRVGRLRDRHGTNWRVRVRRRSGSSHEFVMVPTSALEPTDCPKGWMSPAGYQRYLKVTLAKMKERLGRKKSKRRSS
jgi:hypothetical protein